MLVLVNLDDQNKRSAIDIDVGSISATRRSDRSIEFRTVIVWYRAVKQKHLDNAALDADQFARCAHFEILTARRTQFILLVRDRRFAFRAPLIHDVDHTLQLMIAAMRRLASYEAETWTHKASVMLAPLTHDVDHFQELVFAAMRRSFPLDAVDCEFVALVVFAPFTHDIDHFVGFVFAAMRPFAALDAVDCKFLAPVVVAPCTHDIDHFVGLVFAAMRRFATLDAVYCVNLTPVMATPFAGDIDESVQFAMFRAMRWFPTFTAIFRLFLLRTTILAKRHIISNCRHACALNYIIHYRHVLGWTRTTAFSERGQQARTVLAKRLNLFSRILVSMPANTQGLKEFNKARDIILLRKYGIRDLEAATRVVYNTQGLKGFEGWVRARNTALVKAGVRGGYKKLMAEAKVEYNKSAYAKAHKSPAATKRPRRATTTATRRPAARRVR